MNRKKKEVRKLVIAILILLVMGISLIFLLPAVQKWSTAYYDLFPLLFMKLMLLPVTYLLLGWTLMQAMMLYFKVGQIKKIKKMHYIVIGAIMLYLILIMPYMLFWAYGGIQRQYALSHQSGYTSDSIMSVFPAWDYIAIKIIIFVQKYNVVFIIPGALLWITARKKQEE